jgi:PRTRC genetic system protein E
MFKELSPLLRKGDTLVLSISRETDTTLRVNIMPRLFSLDGEQGSDRKALNTPLSITGTIEELDSPEFAGTLDRFTASATGLRQSIDDVEAAHKAAAGVKKAAAEKEKKPEPKKVEAPKPAPKPEEPTAEDKTPAII